MKQKRFLSTEQGWRKTIDKLKEKTKSRQGLMERQSNYSSFLLSRSPPARKEMNASFESLLRNASVKYDPTQNGNPFS